MQATMTQVFIEDVHQQLRQFYEQLKLTRKMDAQQKARIEGFMFAGTRLGLLTKEELEAVMEQAHQEVFGISIAERKLQSVKGEQQVVDWCYYDKPIHQR